MTSIKDVAKAAGVSTATVSRVLANKDFIRPETRARVLQAVASLSYRPNLVARSLRAQRTARIGLIFSDIRNPFFASLSRAVEDAAYERGYSVLICNTGEDPKKEAIYLELLRDENVAGIVFSPTQLYSSQARAHDPRMPVVIIDREADLRRRHRPREVVRLVQAFHPQGGLRQSNPLNPALQNSPARVTSLEHREL